MKKLIGILVLCCSLLPSAYAWNSNGHKVIAQIAYDNLIPQAQQSVNNLTQIVGHYYGVKKFTSAAPWPDWLKQNNITAYNSWHYINQPLVIGDCSHCAIQPPATPNVVWAIQQAQQVLMTPTSARYPQETDFGKSMFLLFLEHFVGDIHQPMHTVSLFSDAYPAGDKGGTLYPIKSDTADNLHEYWDEGAGLFPAARLSDKKIQALAKAIEASYPQSTLTPAVTDLNPQDWATEGKGIATTAYTLATNAVPSSSYAQAVHAIAERQAALAGYRLANILNGIFN